MGIPELGLAIASGDGEGGRSGQASVLVISGFFFLESRFGDPEVRKCHALLLCILVCCIRPWAVVANGLGHEPGYFRISLISLATSFIKKDIFLRGNNQDAATANTRESHMTDDWQLNHHTCGFCKKGTK